MTLAVAFFYLFSVLTIVSAVMVIMARHPVHSAFYLVVAFFNAAGLFVLLSAPFLATILILIYVCAAAFLLLLLSRMLNIDIVKLKDDFKNYPPAASIIGIVLPAIIFMFLGGWLITSDMLSLPIAPSPDLSELTSRETLGNIIHTKFVYLLLATAMVLVTAIIGVMYLSLHQSVNLRRTLLSRATPHDPEDSENVTTRQDV